jgi:hypothetical protein
MSTVQIFPTPTVPPSLLILISLVVAKLFLVNALLIFVTLVLAMLPQINVFSISIVLPPICVFQVSVVPMDVKILLNVLLVSLAVLPSPVTVQLEHVEPKSKLVVFQMILATSQPVFMMPSLTPPLVKSLLSVQHQVISVTQPPVKLSLGNPSVSLNLLIVVLELLDAEMPAVMLPRVVVMQFLKMVFVNLMLVILEAVMLLMEPVFSHPSTVLILPTSLRASMNSLSVIPSSAIQALLITLVKFASTIVLKITPKSMEVAIL